MTRNASLLLGTILLALTGCAGSNNTTEEPVGSEDELRGGQLITNVAAVEITIEPLAAQNIPHKTVTVALPKKVTAVLRALKKRAAHESIPRCMPSHLTNLKFFDESAKEIGSTSVTCTGGTLKVDGKPDVAIKMVDDIRAIADEALVPGDALWGIEKVSVRHLQPDQEKIVSDDEGVKKLVKAIDADQAIDPHRPMPRCLPTYAVTFKRKGDDAAHTSFLCGGNPGSKVGASFSIPAGGDENLAHGGIDLDPRPFAALFD